MLRKPSALFLVLVPALTMCPTVSPFAEAQVVASGSSAPLFLPAFNAYNQYFGNQEALAVADLNGDGKPDLVFDGNEGFYCYNTLGVMVGNGDGTFQAPTCYDPGVTVGYGIAIADMNGDGKPDLVVMGPCDLANNCATGNIGVLLGNGDGTFQPLISNTTGLPAACLNSLSVADVNGDGKQDAVTFCGTMLVLLGNGDGTLRSPQSYGTPYAAGALGNMGGAFTSSLVADVNGDGILDLVMMSDCVSGYDCSSGLVGFLLGNGDGTFQSASDSLPLTENTFRTNAYLASAMMVADLNGDRVPDIAVASWGPSASGGDGLVSVLLGLGGSLYPAAIFSPAVTFDSDGKYGVSVASADVNRDGKADLVILNALCPIPMTCSDTSSVAVFLGNGDGTFKPPQSNMSGTYAQGPMLLTDLNGDGIADLLVNANQMFVLLGTLGNPISTATSVSSSLNPSQFGQTVTFKAVVTPKSPSPPTGSVAFNDGAKPLGSVALSGGTATLNTSTLSAGTHLIDAVYSGDPSYAASTSARISQVVNVSPSTTVVVSSVNPSIQGKPATFTATVSSSGGGTPTGSVTFKNGTNNLATEKLNGGTTSYSTSTLPIGTNSITAVYGGSSNYSGSTSPPVNQVVLAATTTTLTSSPNPSVFGQSVTFAAVVTSSIGAPPNGEPVAFKQGSTVLGTGTLSGGSASFSTSTLAVGANSVTASYGGDTSFGTSTSKAVNQVVKPRP